MTHSTGQSMQLRLALEPYHAPKKISNIHQWVSAFNIFVSVHTERHQGETPQLMKYCEVVRDIALSHGDWLLYDEQFRYLRQTAPDKDPWDKIHWELSLRVSANFWRSQPIANKPQASTGATFSSEFFPQRNVLGISLRKILPRVSVRTRLLKMWSKAPSNLVLRTSPSTVICGSYTRRKLYSSTRPFTARQ